MSAPAGLEAPIGSPEGAPAASGPRTPSRRRAAAPDPAHDGPGAVRLGLVSLGCDKNTVDSERMLSALVGHGARPVEDLRDAEVILVNTCGFIDAAKEESIETLLRAGAMKEEGACRALVAVGCLVERHRAALEEALPEVDVWLGLRDLDRLVPELRSRDLLGDPLEDHPGARLPLGDGRHVRYLKVSEGCDHGCAFCAIPLWRGRHRSFAVDRLVAEARRLEAQGAVELNLVAQDLAHYGRDFRDGTDITTLLRALLGETAIPWLRLLYIYSAGLREPLVELMASEPRLLPYIDMPIQHASDPVLARMRRPERRETLRRKIAWLRSAVPDLTLRTTVMVGFPGETDDDFRALLDFLEEVRFDRLGAFSFSPQEGTRAAGMEDLALPEAVGRERLEELIEVQRAISAARMAEEVGRRRTVLVERGGDAAPADAAMDGPAGDAVGRTASQADDVDGETVLHAGAGRGEGAARAPRVALRPGQLVEAEVTAASDFDLEARVLRVLREPDPGEPDAREPSDRSAGGARRDATGTGADGDGARAARRRRRALPVAPLGLDTAWGK